MSASRGTPAEDVPDDDETLSGSAPGGRHVGRDLNGGPVRLLVDEAPGWFVDGDDAHHRQFDPKVPCRRIETRACTVPRAGATDWRHALAYPTVECPPGECQRFEVPTDDW